MKTTERAQWVEYLLKQEFAGRGWSKWLLTHPSPAGQASDLAQTQRATDGVEAEIASRRAALEALPEGELEYHYLSSRVSELESAVVTEKEKAGRLQRENEELRKSVHADAGTQPLDPRERSSALRIIGALIFDYNGLVGDYNATEKPAAYPAARKLALDIANPVKASKAISGMAQDMPDYRTILKFVEQAISMTVASVKATVPFKG